MAAGVTIAARDGAGRFTGGSALANFTGGTVNLSAVAAGTQTLIAAQGAGVIIRVYKMFLVMSAALSTTAFTVQFQDGVPTNLSGALPFTGFGSITLNNDGQPWFECTANQAFNLANSATLTIAGTIYYTATALI
jgi:hypothetical protein